MTRLDSDSSDDEFSLSTFLDDVDADVCRFLTSTLSPLFRFKLFLFPRVLLLSSSSFSCSSSKRDSNPRLDFFPSRSDLRRRFEPESSPVGSSSIFSIWTSPKSAKVIDSKLLLCTSSKVPKCIASRQKISLNSKMSSSSHLLAKEIEKSAAYRYRYR